MTATNGAGAAGAVSASEQSRPSQPPNRRPAVAARMDALAEHMAEGGELVTFAEMAGVDKSRVYQMWRDICADLGPQAAGPVRQPGQKRARARAPGAEDRSNWCPPEYRVLNRRMSSNGFSVAERKRIIAEDIAKKAAH